MKRKLIIIFAILTLNSCAFQNYLSIANQDSIYTVLHKEKSTRANILFKYTLEYWEQGSNGKYYPKLLIMECNKNWQVSDVLVLESGRKFKNHEN